MLLEVFDKVAFWIMKFKLNYNFFINTFYAKRVHFLTIRDIPKFGVLQSQNFTPRKFFNLFGLLSLAGLDWFIIMLGFVHPRFHAIIDPIMVP